MRDIADLVFEDAPPAAATPRSAVPADGDSPLRPWGMWGGWGAPGVACAGAVAQAVNLFRFRRRPVTDPSRR